MVSRNSQRFDELVAFLAGDPKSNRGYESDRAFALRTQIGKSKLNRLLNGDVKRLDMDVVEKVRIGTASAVGLPQFHAFFARLREARKPQPRARPKRRAA